MKIKLPYKLSFIFCLVIAVVLVVGYFYLSIQFKNYIERNLENTLKRELFLIKDYWETYLSKNGDILEQADIFADRLSEKLNLRITIINEKGEVIGDSQLSKEELKKTENHIDRPEIQSAIKNGFGKSKRFSNTIKKDLLYMATTFKNKNFSGFVRVAMPLADIRILESDLQKMIFLGVFLVFILGISFIILVSFVVSKPLIEMSKVAKAIAQGDFSKKPLVYSKDEIGSLSEVLSYMSEQIKQDIEKINQEKAKLDAVLSSMFEGIMVVDEKGKLLLINHSLRKQLLIDSSIENKMPIEVIRNQEIQNIVDRIISGRESLVTQEIMLEPEEKIFKVNAVPIIRNNDLEGAVLVFHDITELRKLEKIRQDFIANVSHELRTPISSIKGYAETLLEGAMEDKENLKEFINIIYKDANRLASLIDDLLDLSKIESGKMKMFFEALEIEPIVKSVLSILEKNIKNKNLLVSLDIPKDLPKVLADERRITQVFLNLLDNAVKYNVQNGKINIKAYSVNGWVQVEISDTGIGIPEKDLPRIFERFYRVDKARSRELGGTGLGLAIVKHIIQAHRGNIWVKSEIAKGSTFFFTLPKAENTI